MPTLITQDQTRLYYKDWSRGRPILFSHGWPLSADAWEDQMFFLAEQGYRTIGHDRRGHGRSDQPWNGNNLDTYADDLADLINSLDVNDVVLIGHSTGGGEVARYIARHGTRRVAGAVLVGAIPPIMVKTAENPQGLPIEVFNEIRDHVQSDRSQFFRDLSVKFYGADRPNSRVSQGLQEAFWRQGMQCGLKNAYDCIKAFSETDQTADLQAFDVPTMIVHGDDDQIVPLETTSRVAARLVKDAVLKVYPGAPHGLASTHKDQLNSDLLAFIQQLN